VRDDGAQVAIEPERAELRTMSENGPSGNEETRRGLGTNLAELHILDESFPWTHQDGDYHGEEDVVIGFSQRILLSPATMVSTSTHGFGGLGN
jgi:hypothetical protein